MQKGEYKRTHEGKYCTGQKDSNMLCYSTAERSANVTYYNADKIIAQEHSAFTSGGRKAVPAIASTLPRAREGGAKAISEMERLESKFDRSDQAFKTQVKPPWKLKLHTTRTTK